MDDAAQFPGDGNGPRITLVAVDETYWLFDGEEFLNQLLLADGIFPKPVRCLRFADTFSLRIFIGPERPMNDFWGIHPEIIARLRRDAHLIEIDSSEADEA